MNKKNFRTLSKIVWVLFFTTVVLTFYVNNFLPHGPMYDTGDVVCQNDEHGPCGEQFKEDMRELNIPDWAKFIREDFIILFMGLGILGFYLSARAKDEETF